MYELASGGYAYALWNVRFMSCTHIYIGRWQWMRVWLRNVSDQINICFKQKPLLLVRIFHFQAIALKSHQIWNSCVFKRNKVHSAGIKPAPIYRLIIRFNLNQYMRHGRVCVCVCIVYYPFEMDRDAMIASGRIENNKLRVTT